MLGRTVDDLRSGCGEHNAALISRLREQSVVPGSRADHTLAASKRWFGRGRGETPDGDVDAELHRQTLEDAQLGRVAWPKPINELDLGICFTSLRGFLHCARMVWQGAVRYHPRFAVTKLKPDGSLKVRVHIFAILHIWVFVIGRYVRSITSVGRQKAIPRHKSERALSTGT